MMPFLLLALAVPPAAGPPADAGPVADPLAVQPAFNLFGFPPGSWQFLSPAARAAFLEAGPALAEAGGDPAREAAVLQILHADLPNDPVGVLAGLFAADRLTEREPAAAAALYSGFAERYPDPEMAAEARRNAADAYRRAGRLDEALSALDVLPPAGIGRLATEEQVIALDKAAQTRRAAGDEAGAVRLYLSGTPPVGDRPRWRQYSAGASLLATTLKSRTLSHELLSRTLKAAGASADAFALSDAFDAAAAAGEDEDARALAEVIFLFDPDGAQTVNVLEWLRSDALDRGDDAAAAAFDRRIVAQPGPNPYRLEAAQRLALREGAAEPADLVPVADPAFSGRDVD